MEQNIKLARLRKLPYTVNHPTNAGGIRTYTWGASQGERFDTKEVPLDVFDWLTFNTSCFQDGELKVIEDSQNSKDLVETIADVEEYRKNTHTPQEIEKLLRGNIAKMKSTLKDITSSSEKRAIVDVAKDIKEDLPSGKIKIIAEWMNIPQDILFD